MQQTILASQGMDFAAMDRHRNRVDGGGHRMIGFIVQERELEKIARCSPTVDVSEDQFEDTGQILSHVTFAGGHEE